MSKKKIKKPHEQNIIISHSKMYEFVKHFLTFLHSFLFIVILFTFLGFIEDFPYKVEFVLEILSLVLILLIVVFTISEPLIKRYFIKRILAPFWGSHQIRTRIKRPTKLTLGKEGIFTTITEVDTYVIEEKIKLSWQRKYPKFAFLLIEIELNNKENQTFKYQFDIEYIIVNIKEYDVTVKARLKNLQTNVIEDREFIWKIEPKEQKAIWSGLLPNHPNFGEWIWETLNARRKK